LRLYASRGEWVATKGTFNFWYNGLFHKINGIPLHAGPKRLYTNKLHHGFITSMMTHSGVNYTSDRQMPLDIEGRSFAARFIRKWRVEFRKSSKNDPKSLCNTSILPGQ